MTILVRAISILALLATLAVGIVYGFALADHLLPIWLLLCALPLLFLSGATYIVLRQRNRPQMRGVRWWMPFIWVVLIINSGIVQTRADRATGGGHVETRDAHLTLVVHG